MPIIKSAKKRVRTAEKAAIRNSKVKRVLKSAVKLFRSDSSADNQSKAQSAIDTAAKKGLIHKNKAARQKAQLARTAKNSTAAGATPAKKAAKPATKTTAAKKAATAKAAPKKAAAKSPAKKPAAKK